MKTVKILIASVLFCAMGYTGYTAHEKMTISEADKFMKANIEALTSGEPGGGSKTWPCWSAEKSGKGYWRCDYPSCVWVDGAGPKGDSSKCYAK